MMTVCWACNGKGKTFGQFENSKSVCPVCGGEGKTSRKRPQSSVRLEADSPSWGHGGVVADEHKRASM
jgi:DnaJ-class molecular chaperone